MRMARKSKNKMCDALLRSSLCNMEAARFQVFSNVKQDPNYVVKEILFKVAARCTNMDRKRLVLHHGDISP